MKKQILQKLIPLVVLFLALVLALVSTGFAWMATNRKTDAGGIQLLTDETNELEATVTVHRPLGTANGNYYFEAEPSDDHEMPLYSMLTNESRRLLVHVHWEEPREVTLLVQTDTTYFMDTDHPLLAGDGTGGTTAEGEPYWNSLSSIVLFAAVTAISGTYETEGDALVVAEPEDSVSLWTRNEEEDTYEMVQDAVTIFPYAVTTDIFFIMDYSDTCISYVFASNIGNQNLQGIDDLMIGSVTYVMDFTFRLKQSNEE